MGNDPHRILLADDDEGDQLLFIEAFSEIQVENQVSVVNDGVELMAYLEKKGNPMPYMLFLDLNMPQKNGIECLKEIRSNERLKDIFIAIYSTSNNEKDMEETFRNGANIYLAKPNDFNELKQLLNKAVQATHIYHRNKMDRKNFLLRI